MADDLPPPYTALTRHPMMPRTNHDEAARFNFLTHFNRFLSGPVGQGNKLELWLELLMGNLLQLQNLILLGIQRSAAVAEN